MREIICVYCKKQFQTLLHNKKTCSKDCSYFRNLEINSQKYHESLARDRSCKICKKVFSASDSRRVLCSQECADTNQRNHFLAHTAKKKAQTKKQNIKQCKYCSAQIVDNPKKKYCNEHCSYLSRLTPAAAALAEKGKVEEQRLCKRCNAPFVWQGKRNQKTHCSDFCAYEVKKQRHKEYAAKARRERTPEEKQAFREYRRKYLERYRIRKSTIPNHMNC